MKKLLVVLLFFVSILMPLSGFARDLQPVQSPAHANFTMPGNAVPTMQKVRESIGFAASSHGWVVTAEQPGKLTLSNVIRGKHTVVVNVLYDTKGVSVEYVSSENMKYAMEEGVAYIHPKYNEWVQLLLRNIIAKVSS